MTIQTVFAPDSDAPTFKMVQPSKLVQMLTAKKFWLIVVGLSVLFLIIGGSFFELISLWFGVIMLIVFYSLAKSYFKIFSLLKNHGKVPDYFQKNHDYFKKVLVEKHNFHVEYETVGILIDARAKRIAFTLDPEVRAQAVICDFADVQRWQAYSRGVENRDEYGVTQSAISNHFVSVYIRNPDQPRYDFFAANDTDADQWVARLDALLN